MKTKIICEIGINHNGSIDLAKKLIDVSVIADGNFVKFQKRNPDICVPESQKTEIKNTIWGDMTYLDYKYKIEFGKKEYDEINKYCKEKNMSWFASVWDKDSVDFMKNYSTIYNGKEIVIMKIPSALINDIKLIEYARNNCDFLMISTGMSDENEIEEAVKIGNPELLFHTNSTYPSPIEELNLSYIRWLKDKYTCEIGYSGHEFDLITTYGAVMLGATWVERHITMNRSMWGSDQLSSLEPAGLIKLIRGIRDLEISTQYGYGPRKVLKSELQKRKTLRK